jgi:CUB/sushi domain-containing protein
MDYKCVCMSGYEVVTDEASGELTCGNIDECGPLACGTFGQCIDLVNDYKCDCQSGFIQKEVDGDHVCGRVECPPPFEIEHAHFPAGLKGVFEAVIPYTCAGGHTTDGKLNGPVGFSIECLASRSYSEAKSCSPISCGKPPKVDNAPAITVAHLFSEEAEYACEAGYTTNGLPKGESKFKVKCMESGHFTARADCLPVQCGLPPVLTMATAVPVTEILSFSETAEWACAEGYALDVKKPADSKFTARCEKDGLYAVTGRPGVSTGLLECKAVTCTLPHSVKHAKPDGFKGGAVVSFPAVAAYNCEEGYTVDGEFSGDAFFQVSCGKLGKITHHLPGDEIGCQPVKCGAAPKAVNATKIGGPDQMVLNNVAKYKCLPGYALGMGIDNSQPQRTQDLTKKFDVTCLATGEPTPPLVCRNINDCAGRSCGQHGLCVDLVQDYTCDCASGFEMRTRKNGDKLCGNVDDCPADACGDHGTCIDLVNDYTCQCEVGFELTISGDLNLCTAKKCPVVEPISHSSLKDDERLEYPKELKVTCNEGYTTDGTASIAAGTFSFACQADGTLTQVASCLPVKCGFAPMVQSVSSKPPTSQEFVFGQEAKYSCEMGYTLDGTSKGARTQALACPATGVFPNVDHCKPVTCGAPPVLESGMANAVVSFYGGLVNYKCNDGYTLDQGDITAKGYSRKCLATGTLEPAPVNLQGSCKKVPCGEPPSYDHAKRDGQPRQFGDAVTYKCDDQMTIDGTLHGAKEWTVTCMATGLFSQSVATSCMIVTFSVQGRILDATNVQPVEGATVDFTMGDTVISATTDAQGHYLATGLPQGEFEINAHITGYIAGKKKLNVLDNVMSGESGNIMISPVLEKDGWRAVLMWGPRPQDLDTHVFYGARQASHIYYAKRLLKAANDITVSLDVDDTNGNGPETTTFLDLAKCRAKPNADCRIIFKIKNYSKRPKFDKSEAIVTVYHGDEEAGKFKVGENGVWENDWWSVFMIDGRAKSVHECTTMRCVT